MNKIFYVVELMPPSRPLIEKWSRSELEDKYHFVLEQNLALKKQINGSEGRLRKSFFYNLVIRINYFFSVLGSKLANRQGRTLENIEDKTTPSLAGEKLQRENRILSQKVVLAIL